MKTASISYAKAHLSALLDRVRNGQTVIITDRGKAVARLEPVAHVDLDAHMRSLVERGLAKAPKRPLTLERYDALPPAPKARPGTSLLDALLADREEGW
ncbi:MAG TPA: type II toxin-antitoxin system prevent-host-death family antitoxin [Gemmatimonadaceae bacterium]|jgi:prevent-host-death family protein